MLVDNKNTSTSSLGDRPAIHINLVLAKKMGSVRHGEAYKDHVMGPNIQQEFCTSSIPTLSDTTDIHDDDGNPRFWAITQGYLQLSVYCNWHFLNQNKAFEVVVGASSRSMLMYSDEGGSSVVGDQVTDLLREVNFKCEGKGSYHFEPLHIQYIPV